MVIRGDDNGQNFIIKENLDEISAQEFYTNLLRGHKQWYSIYSYELEDRETLVARYNLKR